MIVSYCIPLNTQFRSHFETHDQLALHHLFTKLDYTDDLPMGSARKHDRARGKDKASKVASVPPPTPSVTKVCGCPVPDPIRCFVGTPLPDGADGVRMECSNEKCPFADVLLHQRCFEAFEEHLLKVIGGL
ncbi:hypothetical protein GCK32_019851, partial [Trichostrongylus colubriformis]